MAEKNCKKCGMTLTKPEDTCACEETLCRHCCECEEDCACGCKSKE